METVHCMSLNSIHTPYNHDPVQAQVFTQRVWARYAITLCTEVVGLEQPQTKLHATCERCRWRRAS